MKKKQNCSKVWRAIESIWEWIMKGGMGNCKLNECQFLGG